MRSKFFAKEEQSCEPHFAPRCHRREPQLDPFAPRGLASLYLACLLLLGGVTACFRSGFETYPLASDAGTVSSFRDAGSVDAAAEDRVVEEGGAADAVIGLDAQDAEDRLAEDAAETDSSLQDAADEDAAISDAQSAGDSAVPSPLIHLLCPPQRVGEAQGVVTLHAVLSEVTTQEVVIELSTSGLAVEGLDFDLPVSPLTILPGVSAAQIHLHITDDTEDEPSESMRISLSGVAGAMPIGVRACDVQIYDNDGPVLSGELLGIADDITQFAISPGGTVVYQGAGKHLYSVSIDGTQNSEIAALADNEALRSVTFYDGSGLRLTRYLQFDGSGQFVRYSVATSQGVVLRATSLANAVTRDLVPPLPGSCPSQVLSTSSRLVHACGTEDLYIHIVECDGSEDLSVFGPAKSLFAVTPDSLALIAIEAQDISSDGLQNFWRIDPASGAATELTGAVALEDLVINLQPSPDSGRFSYATFNSTSSLLTVHDYSLVTDVDRELFSV